MIILKIKKWAAWLRFSSKMCSYKASVKMSNGDWSAQDERQSDENDKEDVKDEKEDEDHEVIRTGWSQSDEDDEEDFTYDNEE